MTAAAEHIACSVQVWKTNINVLRFGAIDYFAAKWTQDAVVVALYMFTQEWFFLNDFFVFWCSFVVVVIGQTRIDRWMPVNRREHERFLAEILTHTHTKRTVLRAELWVTELI